jgi:maleate isomerase
MSKKNRTLIGMLTPSSNTALEPLTTAMLAGLPEVTAHFGRFRVTEISLAEQALGQFDTARIIEAAKLLADAKVDVIAWNGTSAGWLGLESDEKLCSEITAATGIPACTSTLALKEIMRRAGKTTLGLVSPYLDAIQERIMTNFGRHGMKVVAERHLNISVNWDFSEVSEAELTRMVREVADGKPQAIATYCTNLRAAHLAQRWERDTGIPVYDSITTAVWKSLVLAGVDTRRVHGWGSVFELR